MMPDESEQLEITPDGRFVVDGVAYPIAKGTCGACRNWIFYPDLTEFAPAYCAYCGLRYRFHVNDLSGKHYNPNGTERRDDPCPGEETRR